MRQSLGHEMKQWNNPKFLQAMAEIWTLATSPSKLGTALILAFEAWVVGGDIQLFKTQRAREWLMAWFPTPNHALAFHGKEADSTEYWLGFCEYCLRTEDVRALPMRIVLDMALPCVDMAHFERASPTIKMPFSVHTTTGRIALPLSAAQFERFDPAASLHVSDACAPAGRSALAHAVGVMETWMTACEY